MKPPRLSISPFFTRILFCHSQNKEPAARPAELAASARVAHNHAAEEDSDGFVFGASEGLAFTFWDQPILSVTVLIRSGVTIRSPLVGHIQASGMTPQFASGNKCCRALKPRGVVCSAIAN